ncbi:unnamed protein product [Chondrus crispus]|uniref:Uncharacterized protein n=1 Tax=Chondrus crispus TaxID=2769 RepID=R7Q6I7_CHOCR|nr:unnamed protein product [Chondrus crispus]CDF33075.1 unnamed protein product [Chondrus crispus]|eukprot:XP_005712878.1 unnamed protein product [Chondrus crispus]
MARGAGCRRGADGEGERVARAGGRGRAHGSEGARRQGHTRRRRDGEGDRDRDRELTSSTDRGGVRKTHVRTSFILAGERGWGP